MNKAENSDTLAIFSAHFTGKRISRKQYNKALDETSEEIKRGEVVPHQSVMNEMREIMRKK